MAIHETILAAGFAIGSFLGGHLSDTFDRYMPYKFGIAVVLASVAVELVIWVLLRPQKESAKN